MTQWIEREEEREFDERHELYVELMEKLIAVKKKESEDLDKHLADIDKSFKDWKEYQDLISEIKRLDEEIEAAIVKGEFLNITVDNLKNTVLSLQAKKDQLIEEKKISFSKYEETKAAYQAQEDLREKKLASKLNRDKT